MLPKPAYLRFLLNLNAKPISAEFSNACFLNVTVYVYANTFSINDLIW